MSVVVWDGRFLVADRLAECGNIGTVTSKMRKLKGGTVLAWTGRQEYGLILADWWEAGANKEEWPDFQRTDQWCRLIVAEPRGGEVLITEYEQEPIAQVCLEPFLAWGTGRDLALGALQMGATAVQAVAAASRWNVFCGLGCEEHEIRKEE